mmetsp:Transcript_28912/g.51598  ORF Transcript_28912/g.51598 Transcript_28912/m.51598 type:complete len:292 (+) Transcript_28912:60-935(+)
MDDTQIKQTLCMFLACMYTASLSVALRLQCKVFGQDRYLEMSYYLISFFFASRVMFCFCLAFADIPDLVIFLRFNPDFFEVTIASMLTYLWQRVIWNIDDSSHAAKLKVSIGYVVFNLAFIAGILGSHIYFLFALPETEAMAFSYSSNAVTYMSVAIIIPVLYTKFAQKLSKVGAIAKDVKEKSLLTTILVSGTCFFRSLYNAWGAVEIWGEGVEPVILLSDSSVTNMGLYTMYNFIVDILPVIVMMLMLRKLSSCQTELQINSDLHSIWKEEYTETSTRTYNLKTVMPID